MDWEARYSLRWRLPLFACGVMTILLITFLWAAYLRVYATLLGAAGERAQIAADQVAGVLDGQRTVEQLRQIGSDPVLRRFLQLRSDDAREAARVRMNALAGAGVRRVELWDAAGTRLIEVLSRTADSARLPAGSLPAVGGRHELKSFDGMVFWDLVALIGEGDRALGSLLIRSTFNENPPGIFSRLVGRDARVRVANKRGDVWTDFSGPVPPAPVDLQQPGVAQYRSADGERRIGAVTHIRDLPLAAWVEFPMVTVDAPAAAFLRQMIPIALLFLIGAAFAFKLLSSRLTGPLSQLTEAAEAIAAGDYSRRVTAERRDEVGRLSRTFNSMAEQVQESRQRLEVRVAERTARLSAANEELEAFSYSVSHDLRAPLRGIDGFSLALLEDAGDKLSPREAGHLHRVRAAAQRMAELIDDLLELGRVGRTGLRRERVDLSAIARSVAEELRRADPTRQVTLDIQEGLVVTADRGLMRIVLENLLGNAWKFTAQTQEGKIQVGAERIGSDTRYFVKDNGAGFDMAYADKLFLPFQRLHAGTEFKGTGIGLATVHRIIGRHGGQVSVEGVVNIGATASFTLPDHV
jgi:signal transduction histidine kinase